MNSDVVINCHHDCHRDDNDGKQLLVMFRKFSMSFFTGIIQLQVYTLRLGDIVTIIILSFVFESRESSSAFHLLIYTVGNWLCQVLSSAKSLQLNDPKV